MKVWQSLYTIGCFGIKVSSSCLFEIMDISPVELIDSCFNFSNWLIFADSLCKIEMALNNRQKSIDLHWPWVRTYVWPDWSFRNKEYFTTVTLE